MSSDKSGTVLTPEVVESGVLKEQSFGAIRELGWTAIMVVAAALTNALSQFLADHSEQIQAVVLATLPVWLQGYAGGIVAGGVTALIAWLRTRRIKIDSKEKIQKALEIPPPSSTDKYYYKPS